MTLGHAAVAARLVRRLAVLTAVDRAVVAAGLAKTWEFASAPVTLLLITSHFTQVIQGYYFTFYSLLGLQVFVELGLSQVIIQFASHEWSHLSTDGGDAVVGKREALSRLASLLRFALRWYCVGGILVAFVIGGGGYLFFSKTSSEEAHWQMQWVVLCVLFGANLFVTPILGILEGCNRVAEVYTYRFVRGVVTSLTAWASILLGAGLWAAPNASGAGLLVAAIYFWLRHRSFLASLLAKRDGPQIRWSEEIRPLQWRIALSWASGYLVFSLFTPVLFRYEGPIAAGQMGMTLSVVGVVSSISSLWVVTRAPLFGVLIARREYAMLDRVFVRVATVSVLVAIVVASGVGASVYVLNVWEHALATRLLPPFPTAVFLVAAVLLQVSYPLSVYLRAHKKEPFLGLSVISGLLVASTTIAFGRHWGATGMAIGYLAVMALLVIPYGTVIWCRCRSQWHRGNEVGAPGQSMPHLASGLQSDG